MSFEKVPNFLVNIFAADMTGDGKHSYRFDSFLLDVTERQLFHENKLVPLTPKAFNVLVYLVERGGHLVLKDELMSAVWPDSFVDEVNLPRTIHTIRGVLGEDHSGGKFIETVPTKGYRFIAKVSKVNEKAPQGSTNGNGNSLTVGEELSEAEPSISSSGTDQTVVPLFSRTKRSSRIILFTVGFATAVVLLLLLSFNLRSDPARALNKVASIAVLPIKPVNTAQRDEVYETGIAESLIHTLGSMKGIMVRPLSATRKYSEITQDALAAGQEQKVDYVLASNYQMADGKIRVTAQLVNVATGQIEETYKSEKDAANLFAMQDAVAGDFGNRLMVRFNTKPGGSTAKRGTDNEEAYRNYQQAMTLLDQQRPGNMQKANEYLDRAVELDPNYAQAWAGKANANSVAWNSNRSSDNEKLYQASMEAATRAIAIDPNLSDAYISLCDSRFFYELNFDGAETACKRATELDPSSSLAHMTYTMLLVSRGRFDEAFAEIKTAIDLDPVSLRSQRIYANQLYTARRYDEAIEVYRRLVDLNPDVGMTYLWFIRALEHSGHESEAFENLIRLLTLQNKDHETIERFKTVYASSGWAGAIRERIETELREERPNYAHLAEYYGKLGDKDKAFECLEKSFRKRAWLMMYLRVDPRFDPLRDDPRFDDLVRRVEGK